MAIAEFKATETDFSTSLMALRSQAKALGLDVNDENVRAFLIHQSEVNAQTNAHIRWLYTIVNKPLVDLVGEE